ncbi:hypothetical protein Bca4012_063829 [Brassica carinata]
MKEAVESLETMSEKEDTDMKATMESEGEADFNVCTLGKNVKEKKTCCPSHIEGDRTQSLDTNLYR